MKKTDIAVWIGLTALLGSGLVRAQNPEPRDGRPRRAAVELTGCAWKDWQAISADWMKNEYGPCLNLFKLKMSCAHCENIYADVELHIDAQGRLEGYKILKANICGGGLSPALEKAFLAYFNKLKFPESLRNLILEARLGTGLKC